MQRLHVPRREGLSLYVPSAHFTHRDSSFREQTVKDPAGHFLQDGPDNLGSLPLSDCKKTEGEQQQRNQFFLRLNCLFPKKTGTKSPKWGRERGGGDEEGMEGGRWRASCLRLLSWLQRS